MGEMREKEFEILPFKWSVYLSNARSAGQLILEEFKIYLRKKPAIEVDLKRTERASAANDMKSQTNLDLGTNENTEEDDRLTTLAYGFGTLSVLLTLTGNWIPSHIFTIRIGLKPSRKFIITSYFVVIIGCLLSVVTSLFFLRSLIDRLLIGSNMRTVRLMSTLVILVEIVWSSVGFVTLFLLVLKRAFIHNFTLYKANNIVLTKAFQRRNAIWNFVSTLVVQLLSEPLFAVLTISEDFNQPNFFPQMEPNIFSVVRVLGMTYVALGSICTCSLQNVIPILNRFFLCAMDKHVELILAKRLAHFEVADNLNETDYAKQVFNIQPSESDQHFLKDNSLDSIFDDWPQTSLPVGARSTIEIHSPAPEPMSPPFNGEAESSISSLIHYRQSNSGGRLVMKKATLNHGSSLVSKQLFLFRNLAKDLSELKDVIHLYEGSFGTFHFWLICMNGLIVAQWVVMGIVQSRTSLPKETNQTFWDILGSPLISRTALSVLLFAISNIITFRTCDRLPKQMQRLRSKLFNINLDLHKVQPSSNRSRVSPSELKLAWTLYDQVIKLSHEVNLKLVGNIPYSEKCLLFIFSREISVILVYIQVVDIFSYI